LTTYGWAVQGRYHQSRWWGSGRWRGACRVAESYDRSTSYNGHSGQRASPFPTAASWHSTWVRLAAPSVSSRCTA